MRRFFWCTTNNYVFSELPAPRLAAKAIFEQVQVLFQGQHTSIIVHKDGRSDLIRLDPQHVHCTEGRDLTELDRLSYTMH
jgi:hypothetical protein